MNNIQLMTLLHWLVVPLCRHCNTVLVVLVYDDIGEWCLYADIASLASVPRCWYCYTGEWSLHVGIAILVSVPRCWYCYMYTDE